MDFAGQLAAVHTAHPIGNTMTGVQREVASLPVDRFTTIGHTHGPSGWTMSAETRRHHSVALAIDLIARNLFHVDGVFAVRVGKGLNRPLSCLEAQ